MTELKRRKNQLVAFESEGGEEARKDKATVGRGGVTTCFCALLPFVSYYWFTFLAYRPSTVELMAVYCGFLRRSSTEALNRGRASPPSGVVHMTKSDKGYTVYKETLRWPPGHLGEKWSHWRQLPMCRIWWLFGFSMVPTNHFTAFIVSLFPTDYIAQLLRDDVLLVLLYFIVVTRANCLGWPLSKS